MDLAKEKSLRRTAADVRLGIIEAVYNAKSGHPGGSLSIADLLTYLYFEEMNIATVSSFPRVIRRPRSIRCLRIAAISPSRICRRSAIREATFRDIPI